MMTTSDDDESDRTPLDPTQAAIRRECEAIQATWDEEERRRRSGMMIELLELLPMHGRLWNGEPMAHTEDL